MKKYSTLTIAFVAVFGVILIALSCQRDYKSEPTVTPPAPSPLITGYFVEHFDTNADLTKKGWVFKNNSDPLGEAGWRTGRYEQINVGNKKLTGPVTVGWPAWRATNDPHDFISCDITSCGNQTGNGNFSAWLISPAVTIHNGDSIVFWTIAHDFAVDPSNGISTSDRLQLRLNTANSSANVGGDTASVGSFTTVLYDSNPTYTMNGLGGHPTTWTRVAKVINGVPASGTKGRFALRYYLSDAGLYGGSSGLHYPSVVGVDELEFKSK